MKWPEAMLGGHPLISMIDCLYHNILSYVKFIFHILWIQVLSQSSKRDTFEFFRRQISDRQQRWGMRKAPRRAPNEMRIGPVVVADVEKC